MKNQPYLRYCGLCFLLFFAPAIFAQTPNLALNQPAFASSARDGIPDSAFDGDNGTQWKSDYSDPQWIYVDLGTTYPITRVHVLWDTAFATDYLIQVSDDALTWVTVQTITGNSTLDNDFTSLSANGRYLRIYGTARGNTQSATLYGYFLSELEVYSNPNPPDVSITSPDNNTHHIYSATPTISVTVDATAAAGKEIDRVEFYSDSALLGTDTSHPYAMSLSGLDEGTYSITAKAIDESNAVTLSAPVSLRLSRLSVNACSTAPAWNTGTIYSVAGTEVNHLGRLYKNRWYTAGQNPLTNSGLYKVWELVSTCATGTAVNITTPENNVSYSALASFNIHVDAVATSPYRITRVDLFSGSTLIDSDTSSSFTLDWNNVPAGVYTLTAVTTDDVDVTTTSDPVTVNVIAGTGCNAPAWTASTIYSNIGEQVTYQGSVYTNKWYSQGQSPAANSGTYQVWTLVSACPATANLTAPLTGASYTAPPAITLNATATNPSGTVAKVEFYNGAAVLNTDFTAPYTFDWAGMTDGTYTLSVKAYDAAGVIATSSSVAITVLPLQGIYSWTGNAGTTDWNTPANWSPAGIPGTEDSVIIALSANYPKLTNNTTITDLTILSDTLDLNGLQLTVTDIALFNGGVISNGTLHLSCYEARFAGTVFSSNLSLNTICDNVYLNGSVFNGSSFITKQGTDATDNDGTGGNVFNGTVTIINNSVYRLRTGNTLADDFNEATVFNNNSTGVLDIGYNGNAAFAGHLTVNSNSNVAFGAGTGAVILDSSNAQTLNKTGLADLVFNRLIVTKTADDITLMDPLNIGTALTLTQGRIIAASDDEVIFNAGAVVTGASDASFIAGPVMRYGVGSFIFPVGKDVLYRPVAIAPAGVPSDAFTAEYFSSAGPDPAAVAPPIHHVSQCEYWVVDRTAGNTPSAVTLSWGSNSCGVDNLPDLLVARWNGSEWVNEGNGGTTGSNAAGTITTAAAVSSFSPFTLASATANNALPVQLISFTALAQDTRVLLQWSTATEYQNRGFEIQRSADGISFEKIGFVNGNGNSSAINNYSFYDNHPLAGVSYYRLLQTDLDGKVSWSGIISVNIALNNSVIKLMPNPATDMVTLNLRLARAVNCTVELMDGTGRMVYTNRPGMISSGTVNINLSSFAKGIYILVIKDAGKIIYRNRIIKQ